MKKMFEKSKKFFVALSCICVSLVFFLILVCIMAENGKIDLSDVHVVNAVVKSNNSNKNTAISIENLSDNVNIQDEKYTSISDVEVKGEFIFIADKTGKKVYKLGENGEIVSSFKAEKQVNAVVADNDKIYALLGSANGEIAVLDSDLKLLNTISVGHTPTDMVINSTKAYVSNRFDNTVSVINLTDEKVNSTISIDGREPVAMAVAANKIYVACHLPEEASTESVVASNVAVIDIKTEKVVETINLVNGASGVKGITASPDGKRVYVSHIIARYTYPTTQLDRGWINTNGFSIIETADYSAIAVMLDEVELGAANPWGIDINESADKLTVALSGTDEIMIIDIPEMNKKISAVKDGSGVVESTEKIVDYLPFLDGCRTRVALSGKGVRAITISGNTAYIGQYFTGDIATVDLTSRSIKTLNFVEQPENDDVRMGEILFSDANNCYQKWQSCLSCHPDAVADGFNWDNLNDGLGNPKSAKSMLYSHRTPPVMITGIRDSAETAVRTGMKYIQFNQLEEEKLQLIDAYLKSLQPTESPYLNSDGTLTESAKRGKKLFEEQGCVECHPAPLYTDLKTHDVGTNNTDENWEDRAFDTPTLVEVWRTGAWLHDGRYNDMTDVVKHFAPNLNDNEIKDLSNFVLSIGDEGEPYGVEQVYSANGDKTAICKLVAGGKIKGFTVRRQKIDSPDEIIVTAILKDSKGETIKSVIKNIKDVAFNDFATISLNNFTVPKSNPEGVTFTVTITDKSGKEIASEYTLKY